MRPHQLDIRCIIFVVDSADPGRLRVGERPLFFRFLPRFACFFSFETDLLVVISRNGCFWGGSNRFGTGMCTRSCQATKVFASPNVLLSVPFIRLSSYLAVKGVLTARQILLACSERLNILMHFSAGYCCCFFAANRSLDRLLRDLPNASILLVFATKQDRPGALSVAEIQHKLNLHQLVDKEWSACCPLLPSTFSVL